MHLHVKRTKDFMLNSARGQATAGSDGRILLFDSSLFAAGAGGILSPAAAQQITSTGSPIVGLEWLSGEKHVEHSREILSWKSFRVQA